MKEYVTVITRKGQITLPAPVRRAMGLQEGDRVAVAVDEAGAVRVTPAQNVVTRTAGVFRAFVAEPPLTAEELRVAAEEAIAESAVQRSR